MNIQLEKNVCWHLPTRYGDSIFIITWKPRNSAEETSVSSSQVKRFIMTTEASLHFTLVATKMNICFILRSTIVLCLKKIVWTIFFHFWFQGFFVHIQKVMDQLLKCYPHQQMHISVIGNLKKLISFLIEFKISNVHKFLPSNLKHLTLLLIWQ